MANAGHARINRQWAMRMEMNLYEVLRRHAFERNISMSTLVNDILRLWTVAATRTDDPTFSPHTLGVKLPEPPPERYPGYLDSLIFVLEDANA